MIKSIFRYLKYFTLTVFYLPEKKLFWRNVKAWYFIKAVNRTKKTKEGSLIGIHAAANWLIQNQSYNIDGGFSTFYIVEGHTGSYPETSGYIIETLFKYCELYNKNEFLPKIIACADWLLSIQKSSGGWQSGYIHENKTEVVFNTGQVIRGLIKSYKVTKEIKYLDACTRACNWLCEIQETKGYWRKFAFMNVHRVYDSYVAAPLLLVWKETGTEKYKIAAEKNIKWILENKLKLNGWLEDCDNTIKHNNRPILHTIAYTIDGVIDCSILLENNTYLNLIKPSADFLCNRFLEKNNLNGRYDANWVGSESMICTGAAQMSIVWAKLYKIFKEDKYLAAVKKMNQLLLLIQSLTFGEKKEIEGALQGSFPIWGRYEPFAFPNWATKYLIDALIIEKELK